MTCETEGVPLPNIIWTRNGITIPPLQSQTGVNEITIMPKDANDFGDYVCTARNFLGSTQQITTIEEIGKLYLYYLRTEERLNTVMECRGILKKSRKMFFFLPFLFRKENFSRHVR